MSKSSTLKTKTLISKVTTPKSSQEIKGTTKVPFKSMQKLTTGKITLNQNTKLKIKYTTKASLHFN
jgi:hypothetical protein